MKEIIVIKVETITRTVITRTKVVITVKRKWERKQLINQNYVLVYKFVVSTCQEPDVECTLGTQRVGRNHLMLGSQLCLVQADGQYSPGCIVYSKR